MALANVTAKAAVAVEDILLLMDNATGNGSMMGNATVAVPHYPSGYTLPQIVVASIVVTLLMIIVVVGNMLVIIAITTEKALKNIQNWFIASLAVADFFLGLIIMPFSLANELMGYWIFGVWWCDFHSAMDVLLSTASIMNLCLISLDRYWSITQAVEYLKKRTPVRAVVMIGAVWVLSALICIPPLLGWKVERAFDDQYPKCQPALLRNFALSVASFYMGSALIALPAGRLAELYSAKWIIFISILSFAALHILNPFILDTANAPAILVLKFVDGMAAGAVTPSMVVLLARWSPPSERFVMCGITFCGTHLGGAVGYFVIKCLPEEVSVTSRFLLASGFAFVYLFFHAIYVDDHPQYRTRMSKEEQHYIVASLNDQVYEPALKRKSLIPWKSMLTSGPFLSLCLVHIAVQLVNNVTINRFVYGMKNIRWKEDMNNFTKAIVMCSTWFWGAVVALTLGILFSTLHNQDAITKRSAVKIATTMGLLMPVFCLPIDFFFGRDWELAVKPLMYITLAGITNMVQANHIELAPNYAGTLSGITTALGQVVAATVHGFNEKYQQENPPGPQTPSNVSRGALPTPEKGTPSRWRKSNLRRQKKAKRKEKRNLGHEYVTKKEKLKEARAMGGACRCKKKCRELLQGKQEEIFNAFWDLGDYNMQNSYLFGCMKAFPTKRRYPKKTKKQVSSRKLTIHYLVKVNGQEVRLCKQEFLSVHGLQNSAKRIQLLCQQISDGISTPKFDGRGKHVNHTNKISTEICQHVKNHIQSIPKYTSHYSRTENPDRVYLDHDLTISSLYTDYYLDWCKERGLQPVSQDKYRRIFCTEFNIGFKLPKTDTCKTCDSLNIQLDANKDDEEKLKELKLTLELHQRRAKAMQMNLKQEAENAKATESTSVISCDLQQALPVPNLTTGPAFYLRKAWTYNLGLHDCVTGTGYMYMWPENVAKRGSDEIASILYKHFKENKPTADNLIIFTDNCGGQNKNWSLISLWHQLVKEKAFKTIEHRFLVVGHTHLPSDRDFALIEKYKRKHLKIVYVPEDWYAAVAKSKKTNPFRVTVMKQEDFFAFKEVQGHIAKKTLTEDKEKLNFNKICCFKFTSQNPHDMQIKHLLNEGFKSVNLRKRGKPTNSTFLLENLKRKYDGPVPLNAKKVQNLAQLIPYIPPKYHTYYEEIGATSIPRNENADEDLGIEDVENLDGFSDDAENGSD